MNMQDDYRSNDLSRMYTTAVPTGYAPTAVPAAASALTPLQEYNQKNLQFYQDKPLSAYDTFGGYQSNVYNGVSSAALMDPEVAAYFNGEYEGQGAYASSIQQRIKAMNDLYSSQGWNGVLQHAKDNDVQNAKGGVDMSMAHPEKQLSTGAWTWKDTLGALAVLAIPVGGMLLAGAGTAVAGTAGAAAAGEAGAGLAGAAAGAGAGAGAGATAAGLGSLAIDAAIPTVTVTGAAGGAGLGLGTAATAVAGAGTLGAMMGGGGVDPNIPRVDVTGQRPPPGNPSVLNGSTGTAGAVLGADVLGNIPISNSINQPVTPDQVEFPQSSLPPLVMPPLNPMDPVSIPSDGVASNPNTGGLLGNTPVSSVPNPNPNSPSTGSGPGLNTGSILPGLGSLLAGYADYRMNDADKDYYQGLIDKMMGMYTPGTPEATLMEQKMNAKDAAAGRNSQYGVRAVNLAGQLAQTRAGIMTSPTFGKLAEASRGHYDSSLSSLSSLFGNATTSGTPLNNLVNTGINAGTSWLGSLFS